MTTTNTQEQNKWNNTNTEFLMKKLVMNYFPKVTSDTNTLVIKMKNNKNSIEEIQSAVALFVFQEVVNHSVIEILRGASFVCPSFTTVLDYKFSLIDSAVIGITKTIIEFSLEFFDLEYIASLQLDLEELFYTSNFKSISKKLIKSDASELKFKTDAEMSEEAEDGCGGACMI
jgi:hypothetical protein